MNGRTAYDLAVESRNEWRHAAELAQAHVKYLQNALKSIDDIAVAKRRGAAREMQELARIALASR